MKLLRFVALLAFSLPVFAQHIRQPSQMSIDGTWTFATLPSAASYNGYTAYTSDQGPVYSNGSVWASMAGGGVPPTITANTVLGNGTASAAAPQQLAMPSCSTAASALKWTTSTGFGCNSSINAATLGSATFAAPGAIGSGTPSTGAFTTLSATGVITSTLTTGTAPFTVASTTNVGNLNASLLGGATFAAPGSIGSGTPGAGAFTTLTSSSGIALSSLATQATNTITGNATSGTAVPTALAIGTCSASTSALIWTTNTGFGCNTVKATTISPLSFGTTAAYAASSTAYACPNLNNTAAGTNSGCLISFAGTIKNMYVWTSTTPSAGHNYLFTLMVGAPGSLSATGVTCTISDTAQTCNDTTHTAAITAGQAWTIRIQPSSSSTTMSNGNYGLEIDN